MREVRITTDCCCLCILIITVSPSRPHTLLSGNWLSKLLLHCDKLSTGGRVAGRSPERQTEALELRNNSPLGRNGVHDRGRGGRSTPNPWRVRPVLAATAHCTGSAARSDSVRRRAAALDSTCTCYRSCPKYSARSSASCFGGRGQRKVEMGRAEGDHVCRVSPQPQDC